MDIRAPHDRILFKFTDETVNGNFKNTTDWGFTFQVQTDEIKHARWGEVTHVGSDVTEVKVGQYILIEPLGWTLGFDMGSADTAYWATNATKVWAVADELPKG